MAIDGLIRDFLVAHKTIAKILKMPYVLLPAGVPVFLPSSGSMGNNGAITLATALDTTYANCYLYLPANAIEAGSSAGLYYAQMSNATTGTVYNNTYTSGAPTIPSSPTVFVTTGPGAYTQTTATDITLLSTTLPGGAMGANGSMFAFNQMVINSSGNNKIIKLKVGGTAVSTITRTTFGQDSSPLTFRNKGVQGRNVGNGGSGFTTGGSPPTHTTIDTSADATVLITAQLATATDYAGICGALIQINPAA